MLLCVKISELEDYLDAKGVEIQVNEKDESDCRVRNIVDKSASIFSNPVTPPQGNLCKDIVCTIFVFSLFQ